MDRNHNLDQPIKIIELLPMYLIIGWVPLLFRSIMHVYSPSEQTLYSGYGFNDLYSLVKVQALIVLSGVILLVFLYHLISKQIIFEKSIYTIGASIYGFTIIISSIFSEYDIVSRGLNDHFEGMWVLLCYLMLFIAALHYGRQEKLSNAIIDVFLASSIVLIFFGMLKYIGYDPYTEGFLRYFAFPRDVWDTIGRDIQMQFHKGFVSSLYNPNFMGSYAAMVSLLSFGLLLKEKLGKKKYFYLLANMFGIAALVGSRSSAGLIGVIVGLFLFVLMACQELKQQKKKLFRLLAAWVAIAVGMSMIYERLWNSRLIQQDYVTLIIYAIVLLLLAIFYMRIFRLCKKDKVLIGITLVYFVLAIILVGVLYSPIQSFTSRLYYHTSIDDHESNLYAKAQLANLKITENQIRIIETDGREIVFEIERGNVRALDGNNDVLELETTELGHYRVSSNGYQDYELIITRMDKMPEQFIYAYVPKFEVWAVVTDFGLKYKGGNNLPAEIDEPNYIGFEGKETFASTRGYLWSRTLPLLKAHTFIGAGPDCFTFEFPQHEHVAKWNTRQPIYLLWDKPHNWYLQMYVNTGLVSMLAVLAMGIWLLIQGVRRYMIQDEGYSIQVPLIVLTMGYAAAAMFNDSIISVAPVFWILFGLAAASLKSKPRD